MWVGIPLLRPGSIMKVGERSLPIRPGTDGELFAGMLRYIIENDNPNSLDRRYINWDFKK